ncbi:MAG: amidohydrolase [Rhodothermales bacterium]|nr:amidohydrolase [Rhodothermales bacterium]
MQPAPVLDPPLTDEALGALLVDLRRHLHRHPEVGFEEHETSRHLRGLLREHGFEIAGPLAGTGFYVEVEGAHPGPTVAYRTELDALPAPDAKECDYASAIPGAAHLCGHDAHMAVAVGVALLLREQREHLHGTVRVFFQPNEESIPSGSPRMIADGVLDNVREVFCIHVDPSLETGRYGIRTGTSTAASAAFMVHLYSDGAGHSARPHETVDTVWLATQILNGFYQLPGRVHDARRTAVLTACQFHGGQAMNVIPAEVEFGGTLRCVDVESLRRLSDRMETTAKALGAAHGAEVRYEADLSLPPVVNDAELARAVRHSVEDLYGAEAVHEIPEPSMGGEDFAFYLQRVPGFLLRVGMASGPETRYPLHHSRFDLDEAALPKAARLMADVLARRLARYR